MAMSARQACEREESIMPSSPAARTIYYWSFFAFAIGLGFVFVPNLLLGALGLPPTDEPWIRFLGVLTITVGIYYFACARAEAVAFFRATLPGRIFVAAGIAAVAAIWGYWPVILVAVADLGGALWTWSALRRPAPAGEVAALAE
jgi:hypothetical protein